MNTDRARALRRNQTDAEIRLWSLLRNKRLGHKFRRQQPLGPYVLDFVCLEARLVVEADGGQHADSLHDAARDDWLRSQGFRVVRFWNNEVLENSRGVAERLAAMLAEPPPHPPTP